MRITIRLSALITAILLSLCSPSLAAKQSPLHQVLAKGKAVVNIEAIDAAAYKDGKPKSVFDKATGQILIIQKIRHIASVQTGGGIILNSQGIILTAAHTLKNKKNINVTLFDGTKLSAKIIYEVPSQDLSFLLIRPPFPLETIPLANSDAAPVGMQVYAMGRAQWLQGTLTGGQISALGLEKLNKKIRVTSFRIHFKAYKGDSGSPILDGQGNLLGMISAGEVVGATTYAITSNMIGTEYEKFLRAESWKG